jgi:hypothetical protein
MYASRETCHQEDSAAAQTLAHLGLQIFQTSRSLCATSFTYKHTSIINKKQSSSVLTEQTEVKN